MPKAQNRSTSRFNFNDIPAVLDTITDPRNRAFLYDCGHWDRPGFSLRVPERIRSHCIELGLNLVGTKRFPQALARYHSCAKYFEANRDQIARMGYRPASEDDSLCPECALKRLQDICQEVDRPTAA